jgi:putative membrane protein
MEHLVFRWFVNGVALWVAATIVPGISYDGLSAIAIMAIIFGLVNALIRPLVLVATCLVNVLTLGLFTLVVNALMLLLAERIGRMLGVSFRVDGLAAAFVGAIIISAVSFLLTKLGDAG